MEATEHGGNKIFGRKRPVQVDNGDKYQTGTVVIICNIRLALSGDE
jgi:hypothetical protein